MSLLLLISLLVYVSTSQSVLLLASLAERSGLQVAAVCIFNDTFGEKEYLERERVLDVRHRVQKLLDGTVALPVLGEKLTEQQLQELRESLPPEKTCTLTWVQVSKRWAETTGIRIRVLLQQLHGKPWRTNILHIEPVKSYAPHVYHIVLDLECRPLS
uniref:TYW2 N-terminal domain-containing protein n=1 Tax=Chelonoidis abingdonii TaxID=106734 RepID=A0A8C0GSW0_CHEAB